eukprot:COSAG02_NODE_64631_length_260_cov_0.633540_2_plen_23_part_01
MERAQLYVDQASHKDVPDVENEE